MDENTKNTVMTSDQFGDDVMEMDESEIVEVINLPDETTIDGKSTD